MINWMLVILLLLNSQVNKCNCINLNNKSKFCCEWSTFIKLYSTYFTLVRTINVTTIIENEHRLETELFSLELITHLHNLNKSSLMIELKTVSFGEDTTVKYFNNEFIPEENEIVTNTTVEENYIQRIVKNRIFCTETEKGHILIAWNALHFHYYLDQNPNVISDNRAIYAIFLINNFNIEFSQQISSILIRLWKQFNVLNAIAQAPYHCNSNNVFIYRPFEKTRNSWGIVNSYKFETVTRHKYLMFNSLMNLQKYPLKAKIFARCPTAVRTLPGNMENNLIYKDIHKFGGFYGLDGSLLAELARNLNFKVLTISSPRHFGQVLPNGFITGTMGDVAEKRVDIGANGMFVMNYNTNKIELTRISFYDQICVLVPKSQPMPQWLAVFNSFNWQTWTLLFGFVLFSTLILYLFNRFQYLNPIVCRTLNIVLILLSVPIKDIHRKDNKSFFLASCMLFNVIIVGIFQGNLVKSFITVTYYADINTLKELDDSGLRISTSLNVFNSSHQTPLIKSLLSKVEVRAGKNDSLKRTAYERNVAALERKLDTNLFKLIYTGNDGVPLIHIADECPISYSIAYIVPKGSPYLPRFNCLIERFFESGLVQKWYNDLTDSIITEIRFKNPENIQTHKAFSFYDMQSAFFILLIGFALSFIAFICELLRFYLPNLICRKNTPMSYII